MHCATPILSMNSQQTLHTDKKRDDVGGGPKHYLLSNQCIISFFIYIFKSLAQHVLSGAHDGKTRRSNWEQQESFNKYLIYSKK